MDPIRFQDETDRLFDVLRAEALLLHSRWKLYRSLFGGSAEDVLALNQCAPTVFSTFQTLLIDDCIMRICRLTDPIGHGKHRYASIAQLVSVTTSSQTPERWPGLLDSWNHLAESSIPVRDQRNTRIAHADLAPVMTVTGVPLRGISVRQMHEIMRLIEKCLNCVEIPLRRSRTFYDAVLVTADQDSARLMQALRTDGQLTSAT